jgi:hypothetical protein
MRQDALELQHLIARFLGNLAKILEHISCSVTRTLQPGSCTFDLLAHSSPLSHMRMQETGRNRQKTSIPAPGAVL